MKIEEIIIRLEETKDYRIVEKLTRAVFNTPERINRSKINCPIEHYMVHMLRKKDGIMELNFVAEINGRIVGHIIFSNAYIIQPNGKNVKVLNFGPISVLPELQRKGIGSKLMKYSIDAARKLGYGAILFFGHPDFYPRFGFTEAKNYGITDCNGENYPAFMAMELKANYLKNKIGKFIEADIYNDDLNYNQAKEFDKQFIE
jgi:predicted N-acetyltransferase YhbS